MTQERVEAELITTREEVELAKNERDKARKEVEEAKSRLDQSEKQYIYKICSFLHADPNSPLRSQVEDILDYAESAEVDPVWFFRRVDDLAYSVLKSDYSSQHLKFILDLSSKPFSEWESQSSTVAVQYATDLIRQESYGSHIYDDVVSKFFDIAQTIANSKEANLKDKSKSKATIYQWGRDNVGILSDIHGRFWWDHY